MPQPKFVVAIGACACSGGVFSGCYGVEGGVDKVIPVTAYIPGCPPRPEALMDGVVKLLNALNPPKPKKQPKKEEALEDLQEKPKTLEVPKQEDPVPREVKTIIEEEKPDATK